MAGRPEKRPSFFSRCCLFARSMSRFWRSAAESGPVSAKPALFPLGGGRSVSRFGGGSLCKIQCQSASLCISTWDFCCVRIVFDSPDFDSVSTSFARPNAVTDRYSSCWWMVSWSFASSSASIRFAFSWYSSTRSALSAFIRRLLLSSSTMGARSRGFIRSILSRSASMYVSTRCFTRWSSSFVLWSSCVANSFGMHCSTRPFITTMSYFAALSRRTSSTRWIASSCALNRSSKALIESTQNFSFGMQSCWKALVSAFRA
mmetsp:Transcript_33073/g.87436  ORF Transcript_33073/g.87436 Transcript_33073/m.87436 type:complete len:260 (+) Transcript_33073:54-833(+)